MKNLKLISALIIAIMVINTTVFASSETYETLTIDIATEKAISYSKTLKTLSENTILAQESYDDVIKDYLITDQSHEALNLVSRLKSALNKLTNLKASQELEKESIRLNITNFFFDILKAEKELELYKENLGILELELKIAEVKKNLGLMSETEYNTQKISYEKQVSEASSKELAIQNAYRSLNNVLGNDINTRYNIVLDEEYLTFSSIEDSETSLTSYIVQALSSSNRLTELEQSVESAKYQVDTYTTLTNSSSLQSVEISYAQAQRTLADAQTSLQQSVTDLYNNILTYEKNYKSRLKDISEQENAIKILEVKYSLGNATELELQKARYQLKTLQLELEQIIFNHNISKIKLENINLA